MTPARRRPSRCSPLRAELVAVDRVVVLAERAAGLADLARRFRQRGTTLCMRTVPAPFGTSTSSCRALPVRILFDVGDRLHRDRRQLIVAR